MKHMIHWLKSNNDPANYSSMTQFRNWLTNMVNSLRKPSKSYKNILKILSVTCLMIMTKKLLVPFEASAVKLSYDNPSNRCSVKTHNHHKQGLIINQDSDEQGAKWISISDQTNERHKRNSLLEITRKRGNNGQGVVVNGGFLGKNLPTTTNNTNAPWQHYLETSTVNPNYWIADRYHENVVCLLVSFSGIVRIRPANKTFRGGSFLVSPEESLGRRANCERNSRNIFWKFSQHDERETVVEENDLLEEEDDDDDDDNQSYGFEINDPEIDINFNKSDEDDDLNEKVISPLRPNRKPSMIIVERSNRLLSAGFHVVGSVIEFHIAYIECLQTADKNIVTNRYQMKQEAICTNLSVSFDIGSFGDRVSYECNHIWSKTLKDVHYNQNKRKYAGEVQISLKWVRIEKDPIGLAPYSFRKARRKCVWDSILSWQSLTIIISLVFVFIIGFFALCVCSNSNCYNDEETGDGESSDHCCFFFRCRNFSWWFWCWPFSWIVSFGVWCRHGRRRHNTLPPLQTTQQNPPLMTQINCNNHEGNRRGPPPPPPSSSASLLTNVSSNNRNHIGHGQQNSTLCNNFNSNEATSSRPLTQQSSLTAMSTSLDDFFYYQSILIATANLVIKIKVCQKLKHLFDSCVHFWLRGDDINQKTHSTLSCSIESSMIVEFFCYVLIFFLLITAIFNHQSNGAGLEFYLPLHSIVLVSYRIFA